jgi:hypothetical protein
MSGRCAWSGGPDVRWLAAGVVAGTLLVWLR